MTIEDRKEMLALMQEALSPVIERLDTLDHSQRDLMQSQRSLEQNQLQLMQNQLNLEQRQQNLEENQLRLEQRQLNTDLIIENKIERAIQVIAEGHATLNRKLDSLLNLNDRVETLEYKVAAIENTLKQA